MKTLQKKIKNILIKHLEFDRYKFESILDEYIVNQLVENENKIKIEDETLRKANQKINKTKRRWYKTELDDNENSTYYSTINSMKELLKNGRDDILDSSKYSTIEEFQDKELNKLNTWFNSNDSLLVEFPYFSNKHLRSQKTAIKNDVEKLSYKFFGYHHGRGKTNFPQIAYKVPFASTSRKAFPSDEEEDEYYQQSILDNEGTTKVRIKKASVIKQDKKLLMTPDIPRRDVNGVAISNTMTAVYNSTKDKSENRALKARGIMLETIKVLCDLDRNVLFNAIRRIDENSEEWVNGGSVTFKITSITKDIYETVSTKNCRAVKLSLKKLKELNISKYNNDIQGSWFNLIDYLDIDEEDNVTVDIGKVLKNEISNMRTIQIYDDVITELENSVAKLIIFILQEKRIKLAIEKQKNKNNEDNVLFFKASYLFFTVSVFFDKKYKQRYIDSIRDGLNELKEKNVLIEDFEVKGDYFYIYFKPFSNEELRIIAEEENPFAYVVLDYGAENRNMLNESKFKVIE